MMHLYIALLCIAVHPKRFTIMWRGGGGVSPQPPPVCSIRLDDFNKTYILKKYACFITGKIWFMLKYLS